MKNLVRSVTKVSTKVINKGVKPPKDIKVKSSNIKSVRYDSNKKVLFITFVYDLSTYKYLGVPIKLFEQLIKSNSKGVFFHNKIRGKFPHKKIS
jgi:hypothetical protein